MPQKFLHTAVLTLLLIGMPSIGRSDADTATIDLPYVDAIWRVQQVQFNFHSFTTRYACGALERKITDILKAVGARSDLAVSAGCVGGQFLSSAKVEITLASPVPATAESVREATTFDGRQELLARMQRQSLPGPADLQRFPAQWEHVSLTRTRKLRFSTADCELIRALNQQVFPRLSVSLNAKSFTCSGSGTRLRPRVEVAALIAVPAIPLAQR
jgi:hypothetical protein